MHAQEIIATHPRVKGNTNDQLIQCIEQCYDCAQACTACADACLGEASVEKLIQCIRLNLDCADVCAAAGPIASRRTGSNEAVVVSVLQACALACRSCGEECAKHATHHEHCQVCADMCQRCAEACDDAIGSIQGSSH